MVIQEMTPEECRKALAETGVARLACESAGQPYVVPVCLAYDGKCLYGFSTLGQKIEHMRANPLVCLEIDDVKDQHHWMSVVAFGRFEELPDKPEFKAVRLHALELLQKRATWWEAACVAWAHGDRANPLTPVFYRIHLDRMTGRRVSPDSVEIQPAPTTRGHSRLNRLLDRVLGK
ncbi:MAG: pyridoxamine 5'-phosphate oxidase family protein [Blastocatellia bacterium]